MFSISETVFMPELHILSAAKIKVNIKGSMNLKDTGCQNKWLKEDNFMAIDKKKKTQVHEYKIVNSGK